MLIDFSKMEEQAIPGFLGGEGTFRTRMRVDELCKIMRACLEPGASRCAVLFLPQALR